MLNLSRQHTHQAQTKGEVLIWMPKQNGGWPGKEKSVTSTQAPAALWLAGNRITVES